MMRWFRRRLPLFALAVSAPVFLATVALWVRSYQGPDYVHYTSPNQWCLSLISGHGTFDVLYIPRWPQEPELRRGRYPSQVYYGTRYSKRILGFGGGEQHRDLGGRYVNIPHWFVACCAGGAAMMSARSWWRRRRRAVAGRCRGCNYDLRATPGRCPECGTAVELVPR